MHAYLKPLIDPTHSICGSIRVSKKPLMQQLNNSDFNSHSTLIDHQRGGGARICIGQIHYAKNVTL